MKILALTEMPINLALLITMPEQRRDGIGAPRRSRAFHLPRRSRQSMSPGLNGRRTGGASRYFPALIPRWVIVAGLTLMPAPSLAIEGVWHGKYVCTQGPTGRPPHGAI
jgi:hypothetical protein